MAMSDDEDAKLARIERRLELLPRMTRAVFLLARLDNLSYDEIAWRLRLDREAVQRHVARALYTITWGRRRRWWNLWRRDGDDPA
jgi:RNA polymerase sigma-70 factor (ECF subfamily)